MRTTFDKEVDAAYIYMVDNIEKGEAIKTVQLNENIILDFDKDDKLLGIEILNASEILNKESLLSASSI